MLILNCLKALRLRNDERGVTTVEYAIMLVLVALAVALFGDSISDAVTGVFDAMAAALVVAGGA